MSTFELPDLGEGLQEAEVMSWHVTVGDHVVADQPLLSVETDKAVVEVPSPRSGRIARLAAAVGERVRVGAPLVEFEDSERPDSGTVVGTVLATGQAPAPRRPPPTAERGGRSKATPAVRALAQKLGVDLGLVQATGPGDTVTGADLERAAKTLAEAGPAEPLHGVRRAMAQRLARAHAEVVPASLTEEADLQAWSGRADVTVRLARAIASGCAASPALNAWYDGPALARRLNRRIDLGIAVTTEDGLFVPVLRDVASRSAADLRAGLDRLEADLQARTIPPEELRGQTITLSNFGTLGGRFANLVVVPPQVAILGAGRIRPRVVAGPGGEPVVHPLLPLSLTFDHRAVTGGEAVAFLMAVVADLERAE